MAYLLLPEHLLAAHLPFYRRRWFWAVVLLGIIFFSHLYIALKYTTDLDILLATNTSVFALTLGQIVGSWLYGIFSAIFLYVFLIYFSFFRKEINFYTLTMLVVSMIWSFVTLLNYLNNFQ
jgi:hypothetical protein